MRNLNSFKDREPPNCRKFGKRFICEFVCVGASNFEQYNVHRPKACWSPTTLEKELNFRSLRHRLTASFYQRVLRFAVERGKSALPRPERERRLASYKKVPKRERKKDRQIITDHRGAGAASEHLPPPLGTGLCVCGAQEFARVPTSCVQAFDRCVRSKHKPVWARCRPESATLLPAILRVSSIPLFKLQNVELKLFAILSLSVC